MSIFTLQKHDPLDHVLFNLRQLKIRVAELLADECFKASNFESLHDVNVTFPVVAEGHTNRPFSKRLENKHAPCEYGVKVWIATTLKRSKGGQFALHAMALPGNPYDGHTLETVIPDIERSIGHEIERILADAGYRGHNAPDSHKFRVFTTG